MARIVTLCLGLVAMGGVALLPGCDRPRSEDPRETGAISSDNLDGGRANRGTIPVTTRSEEARKLYDRGLALSDQLRAHEARQVFQQAAAKDTGFAMVHYQLALNSPSQKEFRSHLDQASRLAGQASEGERLLIMSLQAAADANPSKSLEYAKEAAAKYPDDPRAHLTLANNYFFGQQDYEKSRDELQKAVEVDPDFSPAYNMLGYSHRSLGNYPEAEAAFKKYIELVPGDPNPYDSYAELLMKTGRFDESIAQYRKALSIDPRFMGSYFGITGNLLFQAKHNDAIAESRKMEQAAQNDGQRRLAMLARTIIYVDQGKTDQALAEMRRRHDLAARIGDTAAMSGDLVQIGDILLNAGRAEEAGKQYDRALSLQEKTGASTEVKDDAKLAHRYAMGRVALARNDLKTARAEASAYLEGAEAKQNPGRIRQAHELNGMIAIRERQFDQAIRELEQADQQDPYVLYQLALAYQGKGDRSRAAEYFKQAADMHTLPTLNYAFIRAKAKQQAGPQSTS